ncbi:unnamed protein product [Vitrella brassicaformis CCMP3155]|uniref:Uncharacterized protein n=1 Tax=Vitrella brassicaformis (strain CCMP3155) TaxID=1169540 RepID=A0A0G4GD72_VITBC|nr:unnamed protein product [Vitrella brassicaformis CCMP3155]|eukprot:CEM27210.1 unnamed protein product [Vitrella brassicaformis CCMP3155]
MDRDDSDDRGARPQSANVDDALDQLGKEKHRTDTLYRTIQTQLAAQRASLTAGDVGRVLGHITRGGDCLKEAADCLSGLTEGDGSVRTGVADSSWSVDGGMCVAAVSDSKRARLDGHSDHPAAPAAAAAAAASAGGVSGVSQQDEQTQNQQHHNHQQQVACGPCLCGLEGPLVCEMASFLTTIEATVLCLVNKDINSKADYTANTTTTEDKTDDTPFGIYHNLTIAKEECKTWANLNQPTRARLKTKLGNVKTARIAWPIDSPGRRRSSGRSGGRLVAECLAGSKSSLEDLHMTSWDGDHGKNPGRLPAVVFTKLRLLAVTSFKCLTYFRKCNWTFPSLVDLRVSTTTGSQLPDVTHIVRSSPQLRTLTTTNSWEKIDGRGSDWCEFASALGQCPHLTTIRGLAIGIGNDCSHLPDLQKALDTPGAKRRTEVGVKKTIEFEYDPSISCTFSDETRPLHTFLTWAGGVRVSIEWLGGKVRMDCSKAVSSSMAPPAVRGPVADVVKQMASQAAIVDLYLGGSRLHDSWKDLHFPAADLLQIVGTADPQEVIESIPKWLLEVDEDGNNVCFPKIDYLDISMGRVGDDGPPAEAWHLPAAPNALSTLLGSLRMFDFHRDYGELEGWAGDDEDEDDDEDAVWERERELLEQAMKEHGKGCMRALATECYEVVKGGYHLTDVDVSCDVEDDETTTQPVSYGRLQLKVLAKGATAGSPTD